MLSERFYPEQKLSGEKILSAFMTSRQALLIALMQSGKTGVFLYVAFTMMERKMIRNVIILCGSDENQLHDQLMDDVRGKLWHFVCDELGLNGDDADDKRFVMAPRICIAKSSGIDSLTMDNRTLVIWDESHYAQNISNRPANFFSRSGVGVTGREVTDAMWRGRESFYLSVSATPFSEYSDAIHPLAKADNTKAIVVHEPGALYKGVKHFAENGHIHESFSIKHRSMRFTALLSSRSAERKYALVRTQDQDSLRRCCEEAGVTYKTHFSGRLLGPRGLDSLADAPDCFTVIGLKGMCRMGKVISKQHIAFVFESSQAGRADTILQSLLGRMCGYGTHPDEPIDIFISRKMLTKDRTTSWDELDRYALFAGGKGAVPLKFMNAKGVIDASSVPLLVPRRIAMPESNSKLARIRAFLDDIRASPCADPIQQEEIVEALEDELEPGASSFVGVRDYRAASYEHVRDKLPVALATHTVFNDDYLAHNKQFLIYYDNTTRSLYLVGYTDDATEETIIASKNPIQTTTGKEVFSVKNATLPPTTHNDQVNTVADLTRIRGEAGRHTLWVHKSLVTSPEFCSFQDANRSGGRGAGKKWDPRWDGLIEDYTKIIIIITITITVIAL